MKKIYTSVYMHVFLTLLSIVSHRNVKTLLKYAMIYVVRNVKLYKTNDKKIDRIEFTKN